MDMTTEPTVLFEPVEAQRSHEFVADQLRRSIALNRVPPGASLPAERELAGMLGVGRATIQAAIDVLTREGLVESRRGRNGGTFVIGPPAWSDDAMDALAERLRERSDDLRAALDFRSVVEPETAALAAQQLTAADHEHIAHCARMAGEATEDAEFMRWDTELHLAIGHATHNAFYAEAVERIRLALREAFIALPESPLWRERNRVEHDAIVAALSTRDRAAARFAMSAHVEHTAESIRGLLEATSAGVWHVADPSR